jgi:dynein heavy chain 1
VSILCDVRDISPVGGTVIWTEQIKNRLQLYMNRVEYIFGADWRNNYEGVQLLEIKNQFEEKLNKNTLVENWNKEIVQFLDQKNLNEKIFQVVQKKHLEVWVNFDSRIISLFKEIRSLNHTKKKIQSILTFIADDA